MSRYDPEALPVRERPTSDLVVLALTAVVAFVVVATVIGVIVWEIIAPGSANIEAVSRRVGEITNTLIGAVVGYLAGKGSGAANALREERRRPRATKGKP
jgi:hypothetical protein